jgi:multiple sugar transport system permease protein
MSTQTRVGAFASEAPTAASREAAGRRAGASPTRPKPFTPWLFMLPYLLLFTVFVVVP